MAIAAILSFGLYAILPFEPNPSKGLALLLFIAIMWLTEAVHITITALMVPILGVLIGVGKVTDGKFTPMTIKSAMATFADPTIYVFFGGFALAAALHVQKLDRKLAMWLISKAGGRLGVSAILICIATAFLSMWVSNTATAAIMLPLALGICSNMDEKDRGTKLFLLIGIAYSASIGGLGTLVGSPPNMIAAKELDFSFFDWFKVGLPIMLILFPTMLAVMYFAFKPNLNHKIEMEIEQIPWNRDRIFTTIVFCITAFLWIFSKPLNGVLTDMGVPFRLSDAWIAVAAAISVVTAGLATWKEVSDNTEWGVLLLFGGGLTLSAILGQTGASFVLGNAVASVIGGLPKIVVIFCVALFIIGTTEFTSNTASAALLVPVFAAIADSLGMPKETLVIIIGIGASCAFIMPVATPPNALVFGTGEIKQRDLRRSGLRLAPCAAIILTLYTYIFFA
ncbi:SLC13 family permease [Campylobacter sp. CS_ED1]|uniref:SLC13 family permease n=1 Tax=unclassified Campylobacter TaxID=2593542 RepID=UPI00359C821F